MNKRKAVTMETKQVIERTGGRTPDKVNIPVKEVSTDEHISIPACQYPGCGCISQNGKHCFNGGKCEPMDHRGRRFTVSYVVEGMQRFVVREYPVEKKHPSLIDAEIANAALQVRAIGRQFERVNGTTAEEFLAGVGI
jgi:hypothetical protein